MAVGVVARVEPLTQRLQRALCSIPGHRPEARSCGESPVPERVLFGMASRLPAAAQPEASDLKPPVKGILWSSGG